MTAVAGVSGTLHKLLRSPLKVGIPAQSEQFSKYEWMEMDGSATGV